MARLINGNGVKGITAQTDADLLEGLTGGVTGIMPVGQKLAAEIVDNAPRVYDGVILTKEGRRIQIDYGEYDSFDIPSGTDGVTSHYLIGYKLITGADESQTCETFVQAVSADGTIDENTLKGGSSEVYVSLYRIRQEGRINTMGDRLLPEFAPLKTVDGDDGGEGDDEEGPFKIFTALWHGVDVTVSVYQGAIVLVNIEGTTTEAITVRSGWNTVINLSGSLVMPRVVQGAAIINDTQRIRYYFGTDSILKIGYAKSVVGGTTENISKGYVVRLQFAFALI